MKNTPSTQSQIQQKQSHLESIRQTLKEEFIGIDPIIDSIIKSISAWFIFPYAYQRPLLINLWGLTGIGKTSLVNRLVELIDFEKRYLRFNLSEQEDDYYKIKYSLSNLTKGHSSQPLVLAMDEFQNFRTLDEMRRDSNVKKNQVIWDLIDSGKIQYTEYSHSINDYRELLTKLKYCAQNGVEVKNGKVVKNKPFFHKVMDLVTNSRNWRYSTSEKKLEDWFIPLGLDVSICEERMDLFSEPFLVRDKLRTLNSEQSVQFLQDLIDDLLKPKTIDCSNALIFILGNLDEAYTMSDNFNPDMGADEFYEESSQITLTHIKNALKFRFRNEQIARLGNNHLIYPSLSSKDYKAFIKLELDRLSQRIMKLSSIQSTFSQAVHELIYSEGVFPTQGCRPVLSTIYQFLHSKLGMIHYTTKSLQTKAYKVSIDFSAPNLIFRFSDKKNKTLRVLTEPLTLSLAKLRKEPRDETQAITAVHEAGHAVLSIALLNSIPEYVYSVTADSEAGGFTLSKPNQKYRSKDQLLTRLATTLGGYMSEKLIFGPEHITAGSESDIQKATQQAAYAIKSLGFGSVMGTYQVRSVTTNFDLFDDGNSIQQEIKSLLSEAQSLAAEHLLKHKTLLLAIANILKDDSLLKKTAIQQLLEQHAPELNFKIQELRDSSFYRRKLTQEINALEEEKTTQRIASTQAISLNINKTKD